MSTSHRLVRWIIDADGASYGDERDRLRYYEAHSAILTAQLYLLPVVAGIVLLVKGKGATSAVLPLLAVPVVLAWIGNAYLRATRVAAEELAWRSKGRLIAYVACFVFFLACLGWVQRGGSSFTSGLFVGAAIGMVVALVMISKKAREQRAAAAANDAGGS